MEWSKRRGFVRILTGALLSGWCIWTSSPFAFAQTVTVTGMGSDRNSALNNAKRAAVREVVGTYIDSRSLMENARMVLDEVYARTQGFVQNITVLNEEPRGDDYVIKARVEVNTQPDSALLKEIAMVNALNDPRIIVTIETQGGEDGNNYAAYCVGAINERLVKEGFSHVIADDQSATVTDEFASINNAVSYEADYRVEGKLILRTGAVLLPKYSDLTNENAQEANVTTGLTRTTATLAARVVKATTREVLGEFQVTGEGMRNSGHSAEEQAISTMAPKVAEKVRELFARHASGINGNVQVVARTADPNALTELEKALKSLAGVHNVRLKDYTGGKGTFFVDTDLSPSQMYRRLRETGTGVFMERSSEGVLEVSLQE
ncbi:MAG: hypothetical protein IJ849_07010 [Selenomonadaceae bacterium]|nr:hypothetical protein [Selenomonadaceae bacterium]